jgi:hypothetical protein
MRVRQQRGEPVLLDDARQVFVESYDVLASTPIADFCEGERDELRENGLVYVGLIRAKLGNEEVVAVEHEFEVPLVDPSTGEVFDRPLRGVFDLVVRDVDGSPIVVDLKTAASRYSALRLTTDLQATTYSYAASRLWKGGARFRFDVVLKQRKPSLEQVEVIRGPADYLRFITLVRMVERSIAADVFLPNDGSYFCQGCAFREPCGAWPALQPQPHALQTVPA